MRFVLLDDVLLDGTVTSCLMAHSSPLARRTAKAKSLNRARDFPPRTGSARNADRCCAVSKTRPAPSTSNLPIGAATQLVSPSLLGA
jgi:hypothetical protein